VVLVLSWALREGLDKWQVDRTVEIPKVEAFVKKKRDYEYQSRTYQQVWPRFRLSDGRYQNLLYIEILGLTRGILGKG
jgi:hypothetical protein